MGGSGDTYNDIRMEPQSNIAGQYIITAFDNVASIDGDGMVRGRGNATQVTAAAFIYI